MKKRFVFVGSLPSHMMGVVSFRSFGQSAELTEDQARDLSVGGSAIVPEEQYVEIGLTAAEVGRFGAFGAHANATPEFAAKKAAALSAAERFRAGLIPEGGGLNG
jgi:hypothetical protein